MEVVVANPKNFENIKQRIKKGGYGKLHVLSDFDRTLTYGAIGGVKTPSIISLLRDGKHLVEGYDKQAHALFDKYHPFEIDPKLPLSDKKIIMKEWWETHNKLLIESGLTLDDLKDIATNGHLRFRDGVTDFLDFLYENKIPLVIFSASGAGDAIQLFFRKYKKDFPNIYYVVNKFNWDEKGKALAAVQPVIHSFNKDETVLKEIPEVYKAIKDRTNVLLLGDGLGDPDMITGFDYSNLLKIGFLNFDEDKLMGDFKKNFDVVITGDPDFSFVNGLVKELSN